MVECNCPEIDGQAFEGVEEDWSDRAFYVRNTPLVFHIPIRIGRDIQKLISEAKSKGYEWDDTSRFMQKDALFKGQVLLEIRNPQEEDPNVLVMPEETQVQGTFFNGPWSRLGTPTRDLINTMAAKGRKAKEVYCWYLTCPVCSKERGYQTVVWATY